MPTFGGDTIRRFASNVSELKKLAARDFEDLLQVIYTPIFSRQNCSYLWRILKCAIPVFDGLFPEPHNGVIMRLLFTCSHWHGLAKLRMHTETTVNILAETTRQLGIAFRSFVSKTCSAFTTRELDREVEARKRRQVRQGGNKPSTSATQISSGPRLKVFSLRTYKYHALGDYVDTIRKFGTSDSYSTEAVSSTTICIFYLC